MKGFVKKGAVIIAAGMLLTGCGEELTTLTESEEAVIVNYSAGTLAKFNKRQQDGLTAVAPKEEEAEQEESVVSQEEETKDNQNNQDNQDKADDGQETVEPEEVAEPEVSLTQALGIPGVEVKYTGYEIRNSYEESTALSMVAAEGNTYFVMKYTLTNTGSEEAVCEIVKKKPIFTLSLNGSAAYKNEVTLLSNDLATYSENLAPGATAEAVLVFEVPLEETTEIGSVQADVQVNGIKGNATM